ncbi:hypothetical protein LTR85_011611 [Meristemomyces frigidus]|nr:hypothetical protein LTR85_011611 [Meristemomyces frigidus]
MATRACVLLWLSVSGAVAQHGTSTASGASASTTASATATLVPTNGAVPLFHYEEQQLTTASLSDLSDTEAALFSFDSINVTSENTTSYVNYTLASSGDCKIFPGDSAWPALSAWKVLDTLAGGALVKTVPAASVCYFNGTSKHNDTACRALTSNWTDSYSHLEDPVEMLSPVYQGLTCQPPSLYNSGNCTLGGYPVYATNVSNVAQIQAAVNFARNTGIRLVIKNTGHDFSGKSGGAGSLSIFTHNLKDIDYIPSYNDATTNYSGPAFKAGAGVQAYEIYAAARDEGLVVVGGEGQTVGVMGGYIQGGGHSPLSSIHGMAADQVLNFEVVTADGRFTTGNAQKNSDLFWALRGGGGSTFGIVTSVVVKAYPDMQVTTSTFSFTSASVSQDTFWAGVRAYFSYFPTNADAGTYSYFFILPSVPSAGEFEFLMQPFFAPNKTLNETQALLQPWFSELSALGISISPKTQHFSSFWDAWNASFPLEAVEKTHVASASRLWPRRNWDNSTILNSTFEAIKANSEAGLTIIAFNQAPTWANGGYQDNSVNPAWRETICHMLTSVNWLNNSTTSEILTARHNFTFGYMQRWRDLSPGAGSYLGESDRLEPDFQWAFYGSFYPRLLALKKQYDPRNLLWAATAVGSEFFEVQSVDGLPNENGRLCTKTDPSLYVAQGPDWVPS